MLEPPYQHFLSAAQGWLALGNSAEARAELQQIPEPLREQAEVLETLWDICSAERNWEEAWQWGELMVRRFPDNPSSWIQRAYATRRAAAGGLKEAWAALRPAFDKFPEDVIIPYNLACYTAQVGELEEAWQWLGRALEKADDRRLIKKMGLAEEDLKPLWPRLKKVA